jgi:hypothetical protein
MKVLKRLVLYIVLLVIYWTAILAFLQFNILIVDDVIVSIVIVLTLINLILTFAVLKMHWLINILCSAVVPLINLAITFYLTDKGWYPSSDFYGMYSAIGYLGLFSVILWEVIYNIKEKFQNSHLS